VLVSKVKEGYKARPPSPKGDEGEVKNEVETKTNGKTK
jgi:hypothetical protein